MPAATDFNGDGLSDVLLRERGGGPVHFLYAKAMGGFANGPDLNWASNWTIAAVGDFNGDEREDVLLSSGSLHISLLQTVSAGFQPDWEAATMVPAGWIVIGSGDFNGDGRADILLRNFADGKVTNWLVGPPDASIVDVPDAPFVPNANFDVVAPSEWQAVATADFNGDGRTDLLWRSEDGAITSWLADENGGFSPNWTDSNIVASAEWDVIGSADFNGDGRADLLWRSDEGNVTNWLTNESGGFSENLDNFHIVATPDWHINGTGDYDGDGRADLLWRNDSGQLTIWLGTQSGGFEGDWDDVATRIPATWLVQPNPSGSGEWDYF